MLFEQKTFYYALLLRVRAGTFMSTQTALAGFRASFRCEFAPRHQGCKLPVYHRVIIYDHRVIILAYSFSQHDPVV